tara:strand:- start:263 stop:1123 length:861 start_codon:yes stop_codon:yes gene_type:complete
MDWNGAVPLMKFSALLSFTIITLALSYCALGIIGFFVSDVLIFPMPRPSYEDTSEIFKIPVPELDIEISATYLESPGAQDTLLYSHGNGEDLGDIRGNLELYQRLGLNVLAYDYPGYGTSEGSSSEAATYLSAEAAYGWLTQQRGAKPKHIILYGRSLGSGPSVELAIHHPVGGLIIEGGFVSAFRVKTHWQLLPWDKFENLKKLPDVHCPILVIHGTLDRTVPFWHGEALYHEASSPKEHLWVEGAGHNDVIEVAGSSYEKAILDFVQLVNTDAEKSTHHSSQGF